MRLENMLPERWSRLQPVTPWTRAFRLLLSRYHSFGCGCAPPISPDLTEEDMKSAGKIDLELQQFCGLPYIEPAVLEFQDQGPRNQTETHLPTSGMVLLH
jgi:hypothetical protein